MNIIKKQILYSIRKGAAVTLTFSSQISDRQRGCCLSYSWIGKVVATKNLSQYNSSGSNQLVDSQF